MALYSTQLPPPLPEKRSPTLSEGLRAFSKAVYEFHVLWQRYSLFSKTLLILIMCVPSIVGFYTHGEYRPPFGGAVLFYSWGYLVLLGLTKCLIWAVWDDEYSRAYSRKAYSVYDNTTIAICIFVFVAALFTLYGVTMYLAQGGTFAPSTPHYYTPTNRGV